MGPIPLEALKINYNYFIFTYDDTTENELNKIDLCLCLFRPRNIYFNPSTMQSTMQSSSIDSALDFALDFALSSELFSVLAAAHSAHHHQSAHSAQCRDIDPDSYSAFNVFASSPSELCALAVPFTPIRLSSSLNPCAPEFVMNVELD